MEKKFIFSGNIGNFIGVDHNNTGNIPFFRQLLDRFFIPGNERSAYLPADPYGQLQLIGVGP
jgi:hypothetical protein